MFFDTTPAVGRKDRRRMHPGLPIERLFGDYPGAGKLTAGRYGRTPVGKTPAASIAPGRQDAAMVAAARLA